MTRLLCGTLLFAFLPLHVSSAKDAEFVSFNAAMSAGHAMRQAGKLDESEAALEAALTLASKPRQLCDAHRMLMSVYSETDQPKKMFQSAEYVVENAPYPAYASLTLGSLLAIVHRKGLDVPMKERYEKRLKHDPKDRTALTIMEKFTYQLVHDHAKRGELLQRLIDLDREQGKTPEPEMISNRAFSYKLSREYVKAAELFESTSSLSKQIQTYCLMEAAEAWKQAGEKEKSLDAAQRAHEIGPDKKSRRSLYRWHRTLGEIFLSHLKKSEAIHHFEIALEEANIDAYREQCEELIAQAKALP
jgi:tetratricopeptide (TPR) repeat protein